MIEIVRKDQAVDSEAFAAFEALILDGHAALNQWGSFWRYNQKLEHLGYPTMTPFARLSIPSRGVEWDDVDVMPLEIEHVDQLLRQQSLIVLEAARCYYITHEGLSIRAAAESLGRKVGGFVADSRVKELLRLAKYVVGVGRVNDGLM